MTLVQFKLTQQEYENLYEKNLPNNTTFGKTGRGISYLHTRKSKDEKQHNIFP